VALDALVLAVLAAAALHGAAGGALRQLLQLGAAVLGWLAARHLSAPVAAGLGRWFPGFLARPGASALLFLGTFALVSLVGGLLLRAGAREGGVVRGPGDRGIGALLGGLKGGLTAWVLLSALALAGGALASRFGLEAQGSQFASLAARHNLIVRLDPSRAQLLERVLRLAREAEQKVAPSPDGETARALLADPRLRSLAETGGTIDPAEAERLLENPAVRDLVEKLKERAAQGK
jgi:membrane protein required for colicin V production